MDTLTLLMLMMLVVLVVIVIQLRRASGQGGTCNCPIDDNWVGDFGKWVEAQDAWDDEVQAWIEWAVTVIKTVHAEVEDGDPPRPPPCKFGSC